MSEEQFLAALTLKGENYAYPLIKNNEVTTTVEILKLAPIPPYFLYDGFEQHLDVGAVYERLMKHNDVENDMFQHLKAFPCASLTAHLTADEKPFVESAFFASTPALQTRKWANTKFAQCFPSLHNVNVLMPPPVLASPPVGIASILAAVLPRVITPAKEIEKDEKGKEKMAPGELKDTLAMCGCVRSGTFEALPEWFHECMVKHTSD